MRGLPRHGRGRNLDRRRQQHLACVGVVHQGAGHHPLGNGPDELAGAPSRRQRPLGFGGTARVAGIAPVGVPARVDPLADGDIDRAAGDRLALGHQLGLDVARPRRLRIGQTGAAKQGGQGQNDRL